MSAHGEQSIPTYVLRLAAASQIRRVGNAVQGLRLRAARGDAILLRLVTSAYNLSGIVAGCGCDDDSPDACARDSAWGPCSCSCHAVHAQIRPARPYP